MREILVLRANRAIAAAAAGVFSLVVANSHAETFAVKVTADAGPDSLRQAILDANASPGLDQIVFAISGAGPHTIKPLTALPDITDTVTIDGYTQPGSSPNTQANGNDAVLMIELDGSMLETKVFGLQLVASSCTIKGLVINGFKDSGLRVDYGQVGNIIQGNVIGPDVDGTTLIGNGGHGVDLDGNRNLVGGPCIECGNIIAGNTEDAVFVLDNSIRDTVLRNSIFANGPKDKTALGIDLFVFGASGVNENDNCDEDGNGSNSLQNFPELTEATSDGTSTHIVGSFNSARNKTYTLEFFANTACDISGFGEGEYYLGSIAKNLGDSCTAVFEETFPVGLADGVSLTATATDPDGNTSEFSRCLRLDGPQPHDLAVARLQAPQTINLKAATPALTKRVKVQIQNRSPHDETIPNLATLGNLVTVEVQTLGECAAPQAVLIQGPPNNLPRTLGPKQKMNVFFDVTYNCANDPMSSGGTSEHSDYSTVATIHHAVLDGQADSHAADDACPHDALPELLDPYPDGRVRDKGCGGKKPDGTLGAIVLTDVVQR